MRMESEAAMKCTVVVAVLLVGLSMPVSAQDKTSCKLFFQVLRADARTPQHLRLGLDGAQKRWWESEGQKKYPGLCLDGTVTAGDKPRYLVILSKPGSVDETAVAPGDVYGETASVIQSAAPKEWIYRPRWDMGSISILSISWDGTLDQPPVHFEQGNRRGGWFWPDSPRVLKVAVKYLSQEGPPYDVLR
jgi:hypothetical protein